MFLYILLVISVSVYVAFKWKHRRLYALEKMLGASSLSLPFIGVSHLFAGDGEVIMSGIETVGRQVLEKRGLMPAWFGPQFFVVIADPVLAERVSKSCLQKHDIMFKCMGNVVGNSSIVAPVSIWRHHRRMLTPTFGPKIIKKYLNVFIEQSEVFVEKVKPLVNTSVPILGFFRKYSFENLCQTTLNVQLDVQHQTSPHPFITAFENATHLIGDRFLKPWLHIDIIYKLLPSYKVLRNCREYGDCFLNEVINSQRKSNEKKYSSTVNEKQKGKSLLQLLLEASEGDEKFSDQEIREEVLGVVIAGTDTTAITSGFLSYLLADHPDVQNKIYKELTEIFETDKCLTPENLSRLIYLEAVIKETLRLYPPIPIIVRKVEEDYELPSGVVLPKGCGVMLHLWAINRNPEYWGADAAEFRPERFLDSDLKHPTQFASFSVGPRNCIGRLYAMTSVKALFAKILRHFRFVPASGSGSTTARTATGLRLSYGIAMKDVNNFPVQLQMR